MKYPLTSTAEQILKKRYIHEQLGEKNWSDVVERLLEAIVPNDKDKYREMLLERYFLPNSPTIVNAGTKIKGLAACYVVNLEDSLESIYRTKYEFAKICQKGGGCGTTLSNLRPEGMLVAGSTHSRAAGPVNFGSTICKDMEVLSQAGFRNMAMMLNLSCNHPDIEKFIKAKTKENSMTTTNISVFANDKFMQAAIDRDSWYTEFIGPRGEKFERKFNAGELLDLIAEQAWSNGEPGLLFEDTINRDTPYKYSNQYLKSCNPCSEQPLPPYGVCGLGSIDISKFYTVDEEGNGDIDCDSLGHVVRLAVRFLDRMLDVSDWPLLEIELWVKNNRPIGLGIMGFADLLLKLEILYGSQESLEMVSYIMSFVSLAAESESERLGELYGVPEACSALPRPRRNITTLSIAPTGTIAILAGCSHGIEPIYSPMYTRVDEDGDTYEIYHPLADKPYFRSAVSSNPNKTVSWKEHIDIQAEFQRYIDSGVSKTVNLPNDATVEDIKNIFIYAWKSGVKGITVYRDNSREQQVLNAEKSLDLQSGPVTIKKGRPIVLNSLTYKLKGGDESGNVYITVSLKDDKPYEIFYNSLSTRLNEVQIRDGIARLTSMLLRCGVPINEIIKELNQIPGQSLKSVPARIAKVLLNFIECVDNNCPECSGNLSYEEGCKICKGCGYSACS